MAQTINLETPWGDLPVRHEKAAVMKALNAVAEGRPIPPDVNAKTVWRWCRQLGIERPASTPKRKQLGVTWRTLEQYERTMSFQAAMDKVLMEFCPDPAPAYGSNGLSMVSRVTDGRRKAA